MNNDKPKVGDQRAVVITRVSTPSSDYVSLEMGVPLPNLNVNPFASSSQDWAISTHCFAFGGRKEDYYEGQVLIVELRPDPTNPTKFTEWQPVKDK